MLNFYKATFKIYGDFGDGIKIKNQNGYRFTYKGHEFGTHKPFASQQTWVITDIKTGMNIGRYARVRKDIEPLLDSIPNIIEIINKAYVKNPVCVDMIAQAYAEDDANWLVD